MLRFLFPPDCFDVSNFVEQAMSHQAAQNIWAKTSYPFPRQWKWQWLISRPQKYILSVSCLVLSYLIKSHWLLLPPCSLLNPIGIIYLNLTRSSFSLFPLNNREKPNKKYDHDGYFGLLRSPRKQNYHWFNSPVSDKSQERFQCMIYFLFSLKPNIPLCVAPCLED